MKLLTINYFPKRLHLRCLTGFWIRLGLKEKRKNGKCVECCYIWVYSTLRRLCWQFFKAERNDGPTYVILTFLSFEYWIEIKLTFLSVKYPNGGEQSVYNAGTIRNTKPIFSAERPFYIKIINRNSSRFCSVLNTKIVHPRKEKTGMNVNRNQSFWLLLHDRKNTHEGKNSLEENKK